MGIRDNAQMETQLLAEWLTTLPVGFISKTHVNVGVQALQSNLGAKDMARIRAFSAWNDWVDARVWAEPEVWLVEAKIVGTANAYGQLLSYLDQYPASMDYQPFSPAPVVGMVLCAFALPRVRHLFERYGLRTLIYSPSWVGNSLATKMFGGHPFV